jgi:hypothetical protein
VDAEFQQHLAVPAPSLRRTGVITALLLHGDEQPPRWIEVAIDAHCLRADRGCGRGISFEDGALGKL